MYISDFQVVCSSDSVVGQLDSSCDDLCGPFLHGVEVLKAQFLLK